jgi:cytosine/adenosine deaminase-related metal-dependent hydrolase
MHLMSKFQKLATFVHLPQILELNKAKDRQIMLRGATLLSMDPHVGDLESGDILIRGSKIVAIGSDLSSMVSDVVLTLDAHGYVITPGMQDAHRHCWYGQCRRTLPDVSDVREYFSLFYHTLTPAFTPEDIYVGTLVSALSAIDAGVTNIHDVLTNNRTAEHGDAGIAALRDAGIRATHVQFGSLTGDDAKHWPNDLVRVQRQFFGKSNQLLSLRLGVLGSADFVPEDVVIGRRAIEFARSLDIGITADAVAGPSTSRNIEQLGRAGLLGADVLFTHCLDLTDDAWRIISDNGVGVAITATSDSRFGLLNSVSPLQKCIDFGISRVGIGIDTEINLKPDLFSQMEAALIIQRMLIFNRRYVEGRDDLQGLSLKDVFGWATISGARATGSDKTVGSLTPGKEADLVAFNVQNINNIPLNNAYGAVVGSSSTRDVEMVMIGGNIRKWDGELVDVDLEALRARAEASRDELYARGNMERRAFGNPVAKEPAPIQR